MAMQRAILNIFRMTKIKVWDKRVTNVEVDYCLKTMQIGKITIICNIAVKIKV